MDIDMLHGHAGRACGIEMPHGHAVWHAVWTCSMDWHHKIYEGEKYGPVAL